MGVFDGGWFDIGGNLGGRVFLCEKCFAEKTLHFRGFCLWTAWIVDRMWITFLTFYDFMRIIASMISQEEIKLFQRTSDLWKKHNNIPNHEEHIANWIELALASGEEILFQFQYDDDIDDTDVNFVVKKGKFVSIYKDDVYIFIYIEHEGETSAYNLYDVHVHHPVIYGYLSKL